MASKDRLHQLVEALTDDQIEPAERYLESLIPPAGSGALSGTHVLQLDDGRPADFPELLGRFLQAIDVACNQAADDEDSDFMRLFGLEMASDLLAYRAEATAETILVAVLQPSGATYRLPLAAAPLGLPFQENLASFREFVLDRHPDGGALRVTHEAGGLDLLVQFDTLPRRIALLKRQPGGPPDLIVELSLANT